MLGYKHKKTESINGKKEKAKKVNGTLANESAEANNIPKPKQPTRATRKQSEEEANIRNWNELEGKIGDHPKREQKENEAKAKNRKWETVGASNRELVRRILGHLKVNELEDLADTLNEYPPYSLFFLFYFFFFLPFFSFPLYLFFLNLLLVT